MATGQITVLVENTAGGTGLLGEHGLSYWIELGDRRFLMDTGQGYVLLGNARRLRIPLEQADAVLLSHGHYDHTGGLEDVLRLAKSTTVYAHPAAFESKFSQSPDGTVRDVGMPSLDERKVCDMAELVWVEEPIDLGSRLRLTGPVPRITHYEDTGGAFFNDEECTKPDLLVDDQAAFIETSAGTVVILGCAHAGVINTLRYIQKLTDHRPIHTGRRRNAPASCRPRADRKNPGRAAQHGRSASATVSLHRFCRYCQALE